MAEIPEPKTRLEQYWAGILDKIEGGGGGNPNYIETIEGTLDNPFGEYSVSDLAAASIQDNINMFLRVDGAALGLGKYNLSYMKPESDQGVLFFGGVYLKNDVNNALCSEARYDTSGLLYAAILKDGSQTSVLSYASQITTTITIIHHPLLESGT